MTVTFKNFNAVVLLIVLGALGAECVGPYEECNAFYIGNSLENANARGRCVPFPECPFLLDILKSGGATAAEIKMLQQLTCVEDHNNPFICCALEDLQSTDYTMSKVKPPGQAIDGNDKVIVFPPDPNPPGAPTPETSERFQTKKEHRNFRLLPSLTECSQVVFSDRILGGNETSITAYPFMARIGYYSLDEDEIKYLCAGTIINKRTILTASHCLEEINPDEFKLSHVRIAEKDRICDEIYGCSTPKNIEIEKVIPHPNYSKRDKSNDIALIRLKEDIKFGTAFTTPVCLPFIDEYQLSQDDVDPSLTKYLDSGNETALVAGWGKTAWNAWEGSQYLQHVRLPLWSLEKCRKSYEHHRKVKITDLQICAGGKRDMDSCGGDSGGGLFVYQKVPLMNRIKMPRIFQFGVVSFGPTHCGVGGLPGVYTKVSAYKDFILDNLEP